MVAVVHYEHPSKVLIVSLLEPTLSGAVDTQGSKHLHLVVLFGHLRLKGLRNELQLITHDAVLLNSIDLEEIHVFLRLRDVMGNVDVRCHDLLCFYHIHVFQLFDKPVELLNSLLVFVTHHALDINNLLTQVWTGRVKMLVSYLIENCVITCQDEISPSIFRELKLFPDFFLRVYYCVLN